MSIQLIDEQCPACGKTCWANNGDIDDLTGRDIDGIKCWNCGHQWLLDGAEDWTTLEDGYIGDSHPTAKEAL